MPGSPPWGTKAVIEARAGGVTVVDGEGTRKLPLLTAPLIFPAFLKDLREGTGREEWGHHALYVTDICLKSRLSADRGKTSFYEKSFPPTADR